jgi:Fe-S-cluster-containing dehydrogenase component
MKYKIGIDIEKCNGCRACELACSLHLEKVFNPLGSAIQIIRPDVHGPVNFEIDDRCDLCHGTETPLCMEFCSANAISFIRTP